MTSSVQLEQDVEEAIKLILEEERVNVQLGFNYTRGETISRNLFDCIAEEIDWLDAQESDKEELINKLKLIVDRST